MQGVVKTHHSVSAYTVYIAAIILNCAHSDLQQHTFSISTATWHAECQTAKLSCPPACLEKVRLNKETRILTSDAHKVYRTVKEFEMVSLLGSCVFQLEKLIYVIWSHLKFFKWSVFIYALL